jgi:hypothetical protein
MPSITLTRLTGFDRNKKLTLNVERVTLGSEAGCDLRFDPTWDKTVTGRHLTLEYRGGEWWVKDSSKDGTFLDGKKISTEKLSPGAVLELGRGGPKVQLDFTSAAALAPSAPAPAARTSSATVVPPPVSPTLSPPPATSKPAGAAKSGGSGPIIAVAAVLVVALAVAGWFFRDKLGFGQSPEKALAQVAKDHADAVGLVVIVHPKLSDGKPTAMATAWAVAPRVYATNSHVSKPVREVLENGGSAYIVVNRSPDKKIKITRAVVHPRYGKPELNFEGKSHAVAAYDVGLLHTDENAPKVFKLAKRSELEKLDSGYRIGYLGFPMEGMAGGGVEIRSPVATMQSGIITSVTDYWLAQANYEKRLLVQHNLGATGGASGSPIFNAKGEIVAILNAGNIIGSVSFESGTVVRAPSSVMVNFAQRVDLLRDIWPDYPKE